MPPKLKSYDLAVFTENTRKKHPPIPINLPDGKTIHVPPAQLWSDEAVEAGDGDPVRFAKEVLGEDYQAYHDAGGTAMILNAILADANGADTGESAAS